MCPSFFFHFYGWTHGLSPENNNVGPEKAEILIRANISKISVRIPRNESVGQPVKEFLKRKRAGQR